MPKLCAFVLFAVGCAGAPVAEQSAAIYGQVQYSGCNTTLQLTNLNQAMSYGRTVTSTYAFQQCVDSAFTDGVLVPSFLPLWNQVQKIGPYQACASDPPALTVLANADNAVGFARSSNPIDLVCVTSSDGIAPAPPGTEGVAIANPELADAQSLAGRIWFEQLQVHGYGVCGGQASSGPSIVADCIEYVLENSAYVCNGGSTQVASCGPNELHLVQDYNEPDYCECDYDPDFAPAPVYGGGGAGPSGPVRKNPPVLQ